MSTEKRIYLIAIGGNALETEGSELEHAVKAINLLNKRGKVIVTHGNGPQVGTLADFENGSLSLMTAQTEGSIGMILRRKMGNSFKNAFHEAAEVVLTPVIVNTKNMPYSKPIGRFYSKNEINKRAVKGAKFKKLIGGYRRVVPSPFPLSITNINTIKALLGKYIVIAGGGGGIPVEIKNGRMNFVDAVIDKDYTSSLLASEICARSMFILTNVDGVYINFNKKRSKIIKRAHVAELERYLAKGEFEEGSMAPKVRACVDFVKKCGGTAVIGNLKHAELVVKYKSGTIITR